MNFGEEKDDENTQNSTAQDDDENLTAQDDTNNETSNESKADTSSLNEEVDENSNKNDGLAMVTEARLKRPTINILADIDHGKTVLLGFCMRL